MVKVLFVCLGNICRSPMAEFVFKDIVKKHGRGKDFVIASAATSGEEAGSPVHIGTKRKLAQFGIDCSGKRAVKLEKCDYGKYDYIIGMEQRNCWAILRTVGSDKDKKVFRLCDFTDCPRDIADPWYTHNFDVTYDDIYEGCMAFYEFICKKHFET